MFGSLAHARLFIRGGGMSRLWITGYRSYEMGTFGDKDPKILVMKYAIEQLVRQQLENGSEWVLTGGQLGVEQWTIEVVLALKKDWPMLKVAMMLPFEDFGSQWQPNSQSKLQVLKQGVDFVDSVSHATYQGPGQLQNYQAFMLNHTDAALLFYDPEFEGKAKYDYKIIQQHQRKTPYPLTLIDMDQLQDYATTYSEQQAENDFFE